MTTHDLKGVAAAHAALRLHHQRMGLEGEPGAKPAEDVWQLLFSLRRYCEASGVDFDKELANVREEEPYVLA